MANPTKFQEETAKWALQTLKNTDGPRRFLVADEVGLGKTMVARTIIERLSAKRKAPFTVYYVASNLRVANQNRERLIDFLPKKLKDRALSEQSRLGLIPVEPKPRRLRLYALTPATSFPQVRSQNGGIRKKEGPIPRISTGKKEERAFLSALLSRACPGITRRLHGDLLRGSVGEDVWQKTKAKYRRFAKKVSKKEIQSFRAELRKIFKGDPLERILEKQNSKGERLPLQHDLRCALAQSVVRMRAPDLVIFDEFQGYDLLKREVRGEGVVDAMLNPKNAPKPAVLLLSATPFVFYRTGAAAQETHTQEEFLDIVEFLANSKLADLRKSFQTFRDNLNEIAKAESGSINLAKLVQEAKDCRNKIEAQLRPVMSRTERNRSGDDRDFDADTKKCKLLGQDIEVFRHLADGIQARYKSAALPYWLSVPLPAQALGQRYQATRKAAFSKEKQVPHLVRGGKLRRGGGSGLPHFKLRELDPEIKASDLALPWTRPSLPWWDLQGKWKPDGTNTPPVKLLLFSRFKATPQSIAALISMSIEARALGPRAAQDRQLWRRRRLRPRGNGMDLFALFHPSAFLIEEVDPLKAGGKTLSEVRICVRGQLRAELQKLKISIRKPEPTEKKGRPVWEILSALDRKFIRTEESRSAWQQTCRKSKVLRKCLTRWCKEPKSEFSSITEEELEDLAEAALSFPGVVAGRALFRHCGEKYRDPTALSTLVKLSWDGFRSYFDNPVFLGHLSGRTAGEKIKRAVSEGCLESVLDEHFWLLKSSAENNDPETLAKSMLAALQLQRGHFGFQPLAKKKGRPIRIRCHGAMPFTGAERKAAGEIQARPDEIRGAFNSPFWPHVLTTTSVGQEGLDFHSWCSRIAHWDLPSNPVAMEQREGRIQRFAGLVVRREIANTYSKDIFSRSRPGSVWAAIKSRAEMTMNFQTLPVSGRGGSYPALM